MKGTGLILFILSSVLVGAVWGQGKSFALVRGSVVVHPTTGERRPNPSTLISCLTRCYKDAKCVCARLTNNGTEMCELNGDGGDDDNYLYYAWDRLAEAMEQDSVSNKKPAVQSTVYNLNGITYSADRAVDGKKNPDALTAPYIAHTSDDDPNETHPWWQVDLKKQHIISAVGILNPKKYSERLHDIEIRVGNAHLSSEYNSKPFSLNSLCHYHEGGGIGEGEYRIFRCDPCPLVGRYVSIQIMKPCTDTCAGKNILAMGEVEVFGFLNK